MAQHERPTLAPSRRRARPRFSAVVDLVSNAPVGSRQQWLSCATSRRRRSPRARANSNTWPALICAWMRGSRVWTIGARDPLAIRDLDIAFTVGARYASLSSARARRASRQAAAACREEPGSASRRRRSPLSTASRARENRPRQTCGSRHPLEDQRLVMRARSPDGPDGKARIREQAAVLLGNTRGRQAPDRSALTSPTGAGRHGHRAHVRAPSLELFRHHHRNARAPHTAHSRAPAGCARPR